MNHHHDDEALARLRASDPATGSHPDLHSLRRTIAAKAPASQGDDADVVTSIDDDLLRGPRVRAPWIAAAAVAAIGMGAGGYALGAQSTTATPAAGGADDAGQTASQTVAADAEEVVPDKSGMGGGGGMNGTYYDPGPVRLAASEGLSDERTTGEVKALVSGADPVEFAEEWAQELGMTVTALDERAQTWFGPNALLDADKLRVVTANRSDTGALNFNYEDILGSPACTEIFSAVLGSDLESAKEEWERSVDGQVPFPDASRCTPAQGDRPSEQEAISMTQDFLASTGLDLDEFEFSVTNADDPEAVTAQVEAFPPGLESGQVSVSASVGPGGVISAWGSVGELTSLGGYPVISAQEAVERYASREFSTDYSVALNEDMGPGADESPMAVEPELPQVGTPVPGMKLQLLRQDKIVTEAELVQGTLWTRGGTLEVPAWKLVTTDGAHYAVLAVADESIDWVGWQ